MERRRFLVWIGVALLSVTGRQTFAQRAATQRYLCTYNECDPYVYDPLHGDPDNVNGDHPIPAGTAFGDLPKDWLCPVCGSPLSYFVPTDRPWSPPE